MQTFNNLKIWKCNDLFRKLQIWLHLPKKSVMENFIFCAV